MAAPKRSAAKKAPAKRAAAKKRALRNSKLHDRLVRDPYMGPSFKDIQEGYKDSSTESLASFKKKIGWA